MAELAHQLGKKLEVQNERNHMYKARLPTVLQYCSFQYESMLGAADENVHLANTKLMTRGMVLSNPVIFTRPFPIADGRPL